MKKPQRPGPAYRPLHTPLAKAIHILCSASVVLSSFAPFAANAQSAFKYKAYVKDLLSSGTIVPPEDPLIQGQLAITPGYQDFGNVPIQTTSEVVFTARNLATNPLAVIMLGQPTITGSSAFSLTHSCPLYLAAGSSCEVRVRFRPGATQTYQGAFSFSSAENAGTPLPSATLWGQGVTANLVLSPDPQSFDAVEVGSTSPAKTVTLSNTAQLPQDLASITSTSSNFQIQSNTCPSRLQPSASCTISVVSAPTLVGATAGLLRVQTASESYSSSLEGCQLLADNRGHPGQCRKVAVEHTLADKKAGLYWASLTLTTCRATNLLHPLEFEP